jgi:hypothetical protein
MGAWISLDAQGRAWQMDVMPGLLDGPYHGRQLVVVLDGDVVEVDRCSS